MSNKCRYPAWLAGAVVRDRPDWASPGFALGLESSQSTLDVVAATDPLVGLIAQSLRSGHRKVAAQRTLMLMCRYGDAPEEYRAVMEDVLLHCKRAEARRMRQAALDWARLTRRR